MAHIVCKIAETEAELQGHFAVRRIVFVEEQALFSDADVDEHDHEAVHLVAINADTGTVVGAVRCYPVGDDTWFGGRLAVLKAFRHDTSSIGPRLCRLAEKVVIQRGCRRFLAHIQLQNVRFFERLGWRAVGAPEMHCGLPHQLMEASLAAARQQVKETHAVYV